MDSMIQAEVNRRCNEFANPALGSGIEVSTSTRELIAAIISAIKEDPHPNWNLQPTMKLDNIIKAYTDAIPMMLFQIVASEKINPRAISAFDFLHWFSRSFDTSLCLIPK
jgi:hypothetical protein